MLWIPGPTEVRPELLAECARPMIGHRSAAMRATIERLDPGLRLAFGLEPGSDAHVAVHSASATAMMEAGLIGAGPRVLALVNGAFSARFAEVAELLGKEVRRLVVPMGEVHALEDVARVLDAEGPFDALAVVSNETSTGTRTDFAALGALLRARHPETHLLVDLVSYIAGAPVDFDASGLDWAFAGVQKAFALPPGIAVVCASERYLARAREQRARGFYLDPVLFVAGHEARKTPATPCIPLYFALARQLEDITEGVTLSAHERHERGASAWRARFEKHTRMQARTARWAAAHGLELLPAPEHASPTVSCIRAGALDVVALIADLKERGHEIGNGYGELKGKTFRIGHMGDHTEAGLEELLAALDSVLAGLGAVSE
jgi:aspartate aminotransferase-like enzyme